MNKIKLLLFSFIVLTVQIKSQTDVKPAYSIFGYVRAWHQTDLAANKGMFSINMSRIGIKGDLSEYLSYRLFVDFSRLGKLSKETETVEGNEVVTDVSASFSDYLLDAYAEFKPAKGLSFQLGQFKNPFSTENLLSAAAIPFINRSLLKSYSAPGLRDIGLMTTYGGQLPLPFKLNFGLFNGSGQNKTENDKTINYAARLVITPIKIFSLSGNYYSGTISNVDTYFWDIGAEYIQSGLFIAAEYGLKNSDLIVNEKKTNSFFLYGLYDILIESELFPIIQPGFRIEKADPDDTIADNEISRYTFGLTFMLTKKKQTHIRLNYEKYDLADGATNPDKLILEFQIKF